MTIICSADTVAVRQHF